MTQVFTEDGSMVPVTVIDASSCTVVSKRTPEKDKYSAVMLGFGEVKEKRLSKAELGTFKKAGTSPRRHLKEFRLTPEEAAAFTVGEPVRSTSSPRVNWWTSPASPRAAGSRAS